MKTLFLVRHAKSDWSDNSLKDIDRPLNSRGHRVAPKMGRELQSRGVLPDVVLASISVRTRQTVEYICEGMGHDTEAVKFLEEIYEASTGALLRVINAVDDKHNTIMIVGHNPSITFLSEYLTDEVLNNVPTCGVLKINFEMDSWQMVSKSTGMLEWFIYPKQLDF